MATVIPPPSKRVKTAAAARAREQQDVAEVALPSGSIRIQFHDYSTRKTVGAPVLVPLAYSKPSDLQQIYRSLQGDDASKDHSFQFVLMPKKSGSEDVATTSELLVKRNLFDDVIEAGYKTTEEDAAIFVRPQAVFKVRAVTRCSSSISGHGEAILATQFSPRNSSRMASGSGDSTARIWDCDTGTPLHTLKGHTSWVLAVAWSPDDTTIATGSMDNTVRLWTAMTGKQMGSPMKGHTKWVRNLAWEPYHVQRPGNPRLASASKDATVRIWNTTIQRVEIVLSGHKGSVSSVKWGGLGYIYTASNDKTIKVWKVENGTLAYTLNAHAHWVNHLALSTDFVLRTGYYDHTGKVPENEAGKIAKAKSRFEKSAMRGGEIIERLVSASDDFTMYLWEPFKSTKPIQRLLGHQKQVNHVTFSPDGFYIASTSFDNHIKLWSAQEGKFIFTLRGHVAPVYQCAFSPDSRLLVSASKDTTLKVWDVQTGKLSTDLPGHKDEVYAVDWSPDGLMVGSGGKDKAVRIWKN